VGTDVKCFGAALKLLEGARNVLLSPDFESGNFETERACHRLDLAQFPVGCGIVHIGHDRQPAETRNNLAQKCEALASKLGMLGGQSGNVAARLRQRGDETGTDRVRCRREDDRDGRCLLLCRENHWDCICDNNIDFESDELGREHGGAIAASRLPAILADEVATFDPAEYAQPLQKSSDPMAMGRKRSPRTRWSVASPAAAPTSPPATRPPRRREAWLRIFVVR